MTTSPQPGQGKIVIPNQDPLSPKNHRPYVHQPWPSVRYHPDGRQLIVRSAEDAEARCPAADGWVKTQFPPKPKPAPPVEPTFAELKAALAKSQDFAAEKVGEILELHQRIADLQTAHGEEIDALRARLPVAEEGTAESETPAMRSHKKKA